MQEVENPLLLAMNEFCNSFSGIWWWLVSTDNSCVKTFENLLLVIRTMKL